MARSALSSAWLAAHATLPAGDAPAPLHMPNPRAHLSLSILRAYSSLFSAPVCSLFNNMSNFMRRPNIIVHLDVSPEESLRRIKSRERECESGITIEYLEGLHAAYEEFIAEIARQIPVIKVNYSQFRTADEMAEKIAEEYERIANIRHVDFPGRTTEDAKKEPEAGAGKPPASPGAGEKPTTAISSPAEGASVSKPVDICASPVTAPL